jgi:hypothetical protein
VGKRHRKPLFSVNVRTTATTYHFDCKHRKVTDYDQVPLGSNYFKQKYRLDFSKSVKPVVSPIRAAPVTAGPDMSASSAAPSNSSWNGQLYGPPFESPHYRHPYQPMMLYSNYYPSPTHFPPVPANQVQLSQADTANHAAIPTSSTPTLSAPQAAVKAFCDKYDFGNEEREALHKLGFRIGDDLNSVTDDEWGTSGLAKLHRRRVLLAWNTEHSLA